MSTYTALGKKIYEKALEGRRGFRQDQLGIDDNTWDEIMENLGYEAIEAVMDVGSDDE
jgi:hypothetical protein